MHSILSKQWVDFLATEQILCTIAQLLKESLYFKINREIYKQCRNEALEKYYQINIFYF